MTLERPSPEKEITKLNSMNIFITGGSGFIGRHLVRELQQQGHKLLLLSNNQGVQTGENITAIQGNLDTIRLLEADIQRFNPDATIHLAWQGIPDFSAQMCMRNIQQGISLLSMLGRIGCKRILFTGSLWEYGNKSGKVSEDEEPVLDNPFRIAKTSLNLMGRHYSKETGVTFIWPRLFYVYGPGQKTTSLIPNTIRAVKSGETLPIKNPQSKHDFVYVQDVTMALSRLVLRDVPSGEYNIGSGKLTSLFQMVNLILSGLGVPSPYSKTQDDGSSGMVADLRKMESVTGWVPKTDISSGIKLTLSALK